MANAFISYSRADSSFVAEFVALLEGSGFKIWYDQHIRGGDDWWQLILHQIAEADVFIYLLSNDSLESEYCRSEFLEAIRLNKRVLPIVVRPKTNLERGGDLAPILQKYNYIDLSNGARDARGFATVVGALTNLKQQAQSVAVGSPSTLEHPTGHGEVVIQIGTQRHTFNHLTINYHEPIPQPVVKDQPRPFWQTATFWAGMFVVLGAIIAGIFGLWQGVFADRATATSTAVVVENTPISEITPPVQGDTPMLSAVDATLTEIFRQFSFATETEQARLAPTQTAYVTETQIAQATASQHALETAVEQAFRDATATQQAIEREVSERLATEITWTPTPTLTYTPTPTSTLTHTPSSTPTPTATVTLTATSTPDPLVIAKNGVDNNADWKPYLGIEGLTQRDFNGHSMVLVPAGQFMMGSTEAEVDQAVALCQQAADNNAECQRSLYVDELSATDNTQIFAEPFWIDRYEVTRAQYEQCVATGPCETTSSSDYSTEPNQPINRVTWFQAQAYCKWRGGELPTEAQWEYASRGPDRLIFSWGDTFDGERANHCDRMCGESIWLTHDYVHQEYDDGYAVTSPVGSYPAGASWVGTLDQVGNVWEWTSTAYWAYPFTAVDKHDISRVLRGGSFDYPAARLRSAARGSWVPSEGNDMYGFRCAFSLNSPGL